MEVQRFNSLNDGFSLRTIEKDGEPWFIAADVCRILDIGAEQIRRLDEDEYTLVSTQGIEGAKNPQMNVVSEPGLYALVLGSRKPEAKVFKRWVTHEVLPQIRKTGSYVAPKDLSRLEILRMALDAEEKVQELEAKLTVAAPKVAAQTLLEGAGGLFGVREAGKQVGMGQKAFVTLLLRHKVMYRLGGDLVPYQPMIDRGYFQTTTGTAVHGEDVHAWKQAKFTAKGIAWIAEKIAG